ncbi:MAG: flavodoxin [Caldilineaceae bacterium]|nr:flavodoxin [Caldilineaceae bacterium]
MVEIGLFYGSTDGNTARVAQMIEQVLALRSTVHVEILDIADYFLDEMLAFDLLIVGVPTWNIGQLQADWQSVFEEFDQLDLTGKRVALFGLGDQRGYPDTFADALFFVADKMRERGAQLVGRWPTDGYHFRQSWAADGEDFLGLVLDEHNQPELTAGRIAGWVGQLIVEFGL